LFTACEEDVTLDVPGAATIDLGEEFDPLDGVEVSGADLEDVDVLENPAFDNEVVNHYVFTYTVNGESATRDVYVQVDELTGTYQVTDEGDDGTTYGPYPVNVSKGNEYNELRFNEWLYDDIIVNANVIGEEIDIPEQNFIVDGADITISGTGNYDGEAGVILELHYKDDWEGEVLEGTSTFD